MLEIRFVPPPAPAAEPSLLGVEFVFRPARIELPKRAAVGSIELVPNADPAAPQLLALTTPDRTRFEIEVEKSHPELDGLSKYLEYTQTPPITFAPLTEEESQACLRLTITNTRDSTDRARLGNYDLELIRVPPLGAEYRRDSDSVVRFRILDIPRDDRPLEGGLVQLARYALQAMLQTLSRR